MFFTCRPWRHLGIVSMLLLFVLSETVFSQEQRRAPQRRAREVVEPLNLFYNNEISGVSLQETYIHSSDGLYIPAVVLKPRGTGPFPAVVMVHGSPGGRGMSELKKEVQFRGMVPERFVQEGCVGVFCDYRRRQEQGFAGDAEGNTNAADIVSVIRYTKSLPYVDEDKVCLYGGSLGALISISAIGVEPVAAAVFNAPPAFSLLGLVRDASGPGRQRFPGNITDDMIDKEKAFTTLRKIRNPVLFAGGTADGLMGMVKKTHALLQELGKDTSIDLYPEERHGFYWGPRKQDGAYDPSPAFAKALDKAVMFFNSHVNGK